MIKKVALLLIVLPFCKLTAQTNHEAFAKRVIDLLVTHQFDSVYELQDAEMRRQIDARDYETTWSNFIENYDTLVSVGETSTTPKDSLWLTETKINFVKKSFLLRLSIDKQNRIAGIFFANPKVKYTPPAYINTLAFVENKIKVPVKGISSEGVLSIPKGNKKFPLVILVGGSGPTDMDGTVGPNKPYKDLAWALAAQGIAVYRFDKRTVNKENLKSMKGDEITMEQEYLIDLKYIVAALAKDARIDERAIFIAGHSQGGFMIPYFKKHLPHVKGYIGLAAPYQTIAEIIPEQLTFMRSLQSDSAARAVYDGLIAKAVYTKTHVYDDNAIKDSLFMGLTPAFVRHMDKNKPEHLSKLLLKVPVLFIQGKRDYQVIPTELVLWQNKLKDACCVKYVLYDKLNHLLMEGEGQSSPSEYNAPNNVPEYVSTEIANWIKQLPKH